MASFIPGTTPTLEFTLPFAASTIDVASIVFAQNNNIVIEKAFTDCEAQDFTLTLRLTQEDTLKLGEGQLTEIQLRIRTTANDALASNIITIPTGRILKDGVI